MLDELLSLCTLIHDRFAFNLDCMWFLSFTLLSYLIGNSNRRALFYETVSVPLMKCHSGLGNWSIISWWLWHREFLKKASFRLLLCFMHITVKHTYLHIRCILLKLYRMSYIILSRRTVSYLAFWIDHFVYGGTFRQSFEGVASNNILLCLLSQIHSQLFICLVSHLLLRFFCLDIIDIFYIKWIYLCDS